MTFSTKALFIVAALGLAACNNPARLGGDAAAGAGALGSANAGIVPGSASDPTSVAYFQQTVGDRVLFAINQSNLSAEGRGVLDGQAAWLSANPAFDAVIEGHADEQGTRQYNIALGARRADEARNYLISRGVADSRLKVVSFGKERPLEICSEESCYAQNRRAVTVLAAGVSG
ncbi:MAG: peptidoglycan-associated lipoprotein Pal [Paracoccaceae bacterium]